MNNQIPSLPKELLQLIRHGENYQIEYKEAKTDLPKTLFDSVCAFSNREGGDIFLGVHDTGVILGVDSASAQKLITNFVTLANNKNKIFPPLYLAAIEYVFASDGSFSAWIRKEKGFRNSRRVSSFISMCRLAHQSFVTKAGSLTAMTMLTWISQSFRPGFQCYAKQKHLLCEQSLSSLNASDLRSDLIDKAEMPLPKQLEKQRISGGYGQ